MNTIRELKLASKIDNLNIVQKFIEDICDDYNINNSYFSNISIAISEAVKNAIIHGNKNDISKSVILKFKQVSGSLIFEITDEGNGFDFNNINDPTEVDSNDSSGTGIYLMSSLSDVLNYKDNGNSVEIIFDISSINSTIALDRIQKLHSYSTTKTTKEIHKEE